jgi:hypothetical protein
VIFLFFLLFSLYFVHVGVGQYKDFFVEKDNFINYEKQKINRYINYEQYGAYGFRVLFQPSPLIVFFSSAFLSLEGTIDTKEIVNISINYKGKSIFATDGAFGDFSNMFYTFGSLLMLIFGLNCFYNFGLPHFAVKNRGNRKKEEIKFCLTTVFSRLLLLNGYFFGVILTAYITAILKGIHFSGSETGVFISFSLYMILFIDLFYFFGILSAFILSFKKSLFTTAYALWFFLCFFIPEINRIDLERKANVIKSNETVNIKKLNNVMRFERRYKFVMETLKEEKIKNLKHIFSTFLDDYMRNEYMLNKNIENSLSEEVKKLIYYNERKSSIIPFTFYLFLTKEFSSYGYTNYQNFLKYMLNLKENFSRYYFERRYGKIGRQVESFVKAGENIFKAEFNLPENFLPGLWLTFFYSLLLFSIALYFFKKRIDKEYREIKQEKNEIDIRRMEQGKTYFSLCRDAKGRRRTLSYLDSRGIPIIETLGLWDFDPGVSLKSWIRYECKKRGVKLQDVSDRLQAAGISTRKLKSRLKALDAEVLNRAYLEIRLAEKFSIYAFHDFLKGTSRQFENDFKERLKELESEAIFLYIGSEIFDIDVKTRKASVEDCRFIIVDFYDILLR